MMQLPAAVFDWLKANARDIKRLADGIERIADELAAIRRELQETDDHEEER